MNTHEQIPAEEQELLPSEKVNQTMIEAQSMLDEGVPEPSVRSLLFDKVVEVINRFEGDDDAMSDLKDQFTNRISLLENFSETSKSDLGKFISQIGKESAKKLAWPKKEAA
jgi:hypothetical protein